MSAAARRLRLAGSRLPHTGHAVLARPRGAPTQLRAFVTDQKASQAQTAHETKHLDQFDIDQAVIDKALPPMPTFKVRRIASAEKKKANKGSNEPLPETFVLESSELQSIQQEVFYDFLPPATKKSRIRATFLENYRDTATGKLEVRAFKGRLSLRFMRDHCMCDKCVDPITRQRDVDVVTSFKPDNDVAVHWHRQGDTFNIKWETEGHLSEYKTSWLVETLYPKQLMRRLQGIPAKRSAWETTSPPSTDFDSIMTTSEGLAQWTNQIREHGFAFVENTPVTETDTEALITRIGPLVNTHYGQFHTMTSDLSSKDSAYTQVALPPHTDTTYFTNPVGLQMLHLLEHSTSAGGDPPVGGESILVDGFRAAEILREEEPEHFETLSKTRIIAHASGNEGVILQGAYPQPVIKVDRLTQEVVQIRWNNADRHSIVPEVHRVDLSKYNHAKATNSWYRAAQRWVNIIENDPRCRYQFLLEPGRPVMFDNWRVLHARTAFTGKRRMCGGYVDRDYFISTWKTGNQKQ